MSFTILRHVKGVSLLTKDFVMVQPDSLWVFGRKALESKGRYGSTFRGNVIVNPDFPGQDNAFATMQTHLKIALKLWIFGPK